MITAILSSIAIVISILSLYNSEKNTRLARRPYITVNCKNCANMIINDEFTLYCKNIGLDIASSCELTVYIIEMFNNNDYYYKRYDFLVNPLGPKEQVYLKYAINNPVFQTKYQHSNISEKKYIIKINFTYNDIYKNVYNQELYFESTKDSNYTLTFIHQNKKDIINKHISKLEQGTKVNTKIKEKQCA
jgi:hypothetical protein